MNTPEFYQDVLDRLPQNILVKDIIARRAVYHNIGDHFLGYAVEHLDTLRREVVDTYIHPDERDYVWLHENRLPDLVDGEVVGITYRTRHADGSWRWLRHSDQVLSRDPDGRVRRVLSMIEDITENNHAEAQLAASIAERERVRLIASFVQDASHEFRTPLSTIHASAYLLRRQVDDERLLRYLDRIDQQGHIILGLVEALLLMAEMDGGRPLDLSAIDIQDCVRSGLERYRQAATDRGVALVAEIPPNLPPLEGDLDRLMCGFAAVVDNAVRHTPAGGRVTVRTRLDRRQIVCTISDTGCGIAPDDLPHVFERFYRADSARSTQGFGLGLPIARSVIERHGGSIAVDSVAGSGTTVTICLPVTQG
jgi:PAS domain S-box-containing protein